MSIGERIKLLRGATSREDFGKLFGKNRNTILHYENDTNTPGSDFVVELCRRYNVSADWVLYGKKMAFPDGQAEGVTQKPRRLEDNQEADEAGEIDPADGDVDLSRGVGLLAKIYGSNNKVLIRAIIANLLAFTEAIDNKQRAVNSEKMMAQIETRLSALEQAAISKAPKAGNGG